MEARGISALIITDANDMNYVTGYNALSHYVPQAVVITQSDIFFILRSMDRYAAVLSCWLEDEQIIGYSDASMLSDDDTPWHFIARKLADLDVSQSTVGFDISGKFITASEWQVITTLLPQAKLVDSTLLVTQVRVIKSPQELDYMRKSARISEAAISAAIEMAAPGVRECDLAGEVSKHLISGTAEAAGTLAFPFILSSGEGIKTAHMMWTDRRLEDGDSINLEVAGRHNWYACPMSRSIQLGTPSSSMLKLEEATIAGMEAAFASVKPGVLCEDVERAFRAETSKFGFEKESRIGYTVGLGWTPPSWIEMAASLAPGDVTELKPGMTFHLMLGMWFQDVGMVLSETFVVNEDGCEVFGSLPRQLIRK